MRLRSPLSAALSLALVALALVLAACGGSSGTPASQQSADQLLKDTFGPNHSIKSGKLDVALNLNLKGLSGLSGPIAIKLGGPFESQGSGKLPKFDIALNFGAGASAISAGAVSTGDKGYLKLRNQVYDVGDQVFNQFKQGYISALKGTGKKGAKNTTLQSLGIDPRAWLTNPVKAGTAKVGGADTVRVTAGIDVAKLLDDVNTLLGKAGSLGGVAGAPAVPQRLTAAQRRDVARAVKSAKLEVYAGENDRTLRRLKIDVTLDVPADVRSQVGGLTGGTIALDLTIGDLNKSQTISVPKGAKPLTDLLASLGVTSGLGSTGSTGSTGSSGSGGSAAGQKYLQCLQNAGQSIAKVQQCASLAP